ncbi:MAG: hypothetical protein R3335_06510 [Anaerolineales bacterium]|nr:hypothetical protein [Anaerolineales bacterium]
MTRTHLLSLLTTALLALGLLAVATARAQAAGAPPQAGFQQDRGGPVLLEANITTTPTETEPAVTQTPTPTDTPPPTDLPPTATPSPTQTSLPGFFRPVVVVTSYQSRTGTITPGGGFKLTFNLANQCQVAANNIIVTFVAGELIPAGTGGVITVGRMDPGQGVDLSQQFTASAALAGQGPINLEAQISYTDEGGSPYSASFALGLNSGLPQPTSAPPSGPGGPTPTPTSEVRAQLVIQDTRTNPDVLQPGTHFILEVDVANVGDAGARRVTMISGGGTITPGDPENPDQPQGQPGVSASGGEFTDFSPLGTSNVQSIGDIPAGVSIVARQPLIVNVSTTPGAHSFKISFAYFDEKGALHVEDQVITLLVYLQPTIEVSFYRDPGPLFAGQPNSLPIQIVNLGRKSVVLGNMRVIAPDGELMNNSILVGNLDAGGYFTIDPTFIPFGAGPLNLEVTVDYTDDFNQPQTIMRTIPVEILEAPPIEEPPVDGGVDPGMPVIPEQETTWQIVMRFIRGMVGLDSGKPEGSVPEGMPGEIPFEQGPVDGPPVIMQ